MTPVNAVLVFLGVAGGINSLGDVRQRSLSQPVTRSWPSSQLCHGDVAEWQTRTVQVRVSERTWGFNSPHPHRVQGASARGKRGPGPSVMSAQGAEPPETPRCLASRWVGGPSGWALWWSRWVGPLDWWSRWGGFAVWSPRGPGIGGVCHSLVVGHDSLTVRVSADWRSMCRVINRLT